MHIYVCVRACVCTTTVHGGVCDVMVKVFCVPTDSADDCSLYVLTVVCALSSSLLVVAFLSSRRLFLIVAALLYFSHSVSGRAGMGVALTLGR